MAGAFSSAFSSAFDIGSVVSSTEPVPGGGPGKIRGSSGGRRVSQADLDKAVRALRALRDRPNLKKRKQRDLVAEALEAAALPIGLLEYAEAAPQLGALTEALQSAANATRVSDVLAEVARIEALAAALMDALRRQEAVQAWMLEMEDEDAAITMLLLS